MITKGNQRGGGLQLAAHLQNGFTNESVEIADLRGAVAPGLAGAFAEWYAQSKATKAEKYLYSLSVNPDAQQGGLTREQYFDFISRVEARLKLQSQPRAVVFHIKDGREHCHVVWSRIDTENMRAVPIAHDHQKLRRVAQAFAKEHGLELPAGMKKDGRKERFEEKKKTADLGEKQQEERSGLTKAEHIAAITQAWQSTKTGEELIRALAAKDYYIARGDKRGYVVVDLAGEIHSLSRHIKGAKATDLKARLSAVPPNELPSVNKAVDYAREMREYRRRTQTAENAPTPQGPTPDERRAQLRARQQLDRGPLAKRIEDMKLRHAREAGKLVIEQATANAAIGRRRVEFASKGLPSLFMKLYGMNKIAEIAYTYIDKDRLRQQNTEIAALQKTHKAERVEANRALAALQRVQKRERKSLETTLSREEFQRIAAPGRGRATDGKGKTKPPERENHAHEPQQALRETFNTLSSLVPAKPTQQGRKRPSLKEFFNRAAGDLDATMRPRDDAKAPNRDEIVVEPTNDGPSLRDAFEAAAKGRSEPEPDKTAPDRPTGGLADDFNRAAAARERDGNGLEKTFEKRYRTLPADRSVRR